MAPRGSRDPEGAAFRELDPGRSRAAAWLTLAQHLVETTTVSPNAVLLPAMPSAAPSVARTGEADDGGHALVGQGVIAASAAAKALPNGAGCSSIMQCPAPASVVNVAACSRAQPGTCQSFDDLCPAIR